MKSYQHIPEKYVQTKSDKKFIEDGGTWQPERGQRVREFCEKYVVPSRGFGADKPVKLLPWQFDDLILPLFSWIKPDGFPPLPGRLPVRPPAER